MKKTVLILAIITIFSKILGFARDIVLSYFYGTSYISDAYLVSLSIPMTIFSFFGTAISTCYIPIYNNIKELENEKNAQKFTSNLINILLITLTFFMIVGFFYTENIVRIFASGFKNDTLQLAIYFTRISLFGMYFSIIIYIFNSYLQIKNNFIAPALVGIPFNLISILFIVLSNRYNISLIAIGNLLAIFSQLFILIPYILKNKFKYYIIFDLKNEFVKKVVYLSIPVMFGASVNQINVLVDKTIASQISIGGISALNYANKLVWFIQGIIIMSMSTVIYPHISKLVLDKNTKKIEEILSKSIIIISLLVVPITSGAIIFSKQIITILFARGAFGNTAIEMTSYVFTFYSLGMLGIGLREIFSKFFYSYQDTKTPMINGSIGLVLNIILNIILSKYLGIGGLALSTSISSIFTSILMFLYLIKKLDNFDLENMHVSFFKIFIASTFMAVTSKKIYIYICSFISPNIAFYISILFGVISYSIYIFFLKIDEAKDIFALIKKYIVFNKK